MAALLPFPLERCSNAATTTTTQSFEQNLHSHLSNHLSSHMQNHLPIVLAADDLFSDLATDEAGATAFLLAALGEGDDSSIDEALALLTVQCCDEDLAPMWYDILLHTIFSASFSTSFSSLSAPFTASAPALTADENAPVTTIDYARREKLALAFAALAPAEKYNSFLLEKLQSKNVEDRTFAAMALGTVENGSAVEPLAWALYKDADMPVRIAAAYSLGAIGSIATPVLVEATQHAPAELLSVVLHNLKLSNTNAIDDLFPEYCAYPCPHVRHAALSALRLRKHPDALAYARRALLDQYPQCRSLAASIVERFGAWSDAASLLPLLGDDDDSVRAAARQALQTLKQRRRALMPT